MEGSKNKRKSAYPAAVGIFLREGFLVVLGFLAPGLSAAEALAPARLRVAAWVLGAAGGGGRGSAQAKGMACVISSITQSSSSDASWGQDRVRGLPGPEVRDTGIDKWSSSSGSSMSGVAGMAWSARQPPLAHLLSSRV